MTESDLIRLLAGGTSQSCVPLELHVQQIREARDVDMEDAYWRQYLANAQDPVLLPAETHDAEHVVGRSSCGPHFLEKSSLTLPQGAVHGPSGTKNPSAVILFAFARTLSHFTGSSRPTFGLSHASRILAPATGARDIDLTRASIPTLTMTPMSVDVEDDHARASIQHHLAQLARFSQSENARKSCPKFNAHINITFADGAQVRQPERKEQASPKHSRGGDWTSPSHRTTLQLRSPLF